MKTHLLKYTTAFISLLFPAVVFAQSILYSPNSYTYTVGTDQNITINPTVTGATPLGFGPGVPLSGATLVGPWGLGINPVNGNVYIASGGNGKKDRGSISVFNSSGVYQGTFGDQNVLNPQGIAFDQSGNAYILSYQYSDNGNQKGNAKVDKFSPAGVYLSTIVQNLNTADGMTNDQSNNIYVAQGSFNGGNKVVAQYNSSGLPLFSISGTNPVGVAVDASGNIYELDNTTKSVYEYSSTGGLIRTLTAGNVLTNPYGIAVDAGGDIYIGDSGAGAGLGSNATTAGQGKVVVYNSSGTLLLTLPGYTDPRGLIVDGTGNLYVSDYSNNTITRYPATGGFFLDKPLPPGLNFNSNTGQFSGTPTAAYGPVT